MHIIPRTTYDKLHESWLDSARISIRKKNIRRVLISSDVGNKSLDRQIRISQRQIREVYKRRARNNCQVNFYSNHFWNSRFSSSRIINRGMNVMGKSAIRMMPVIFIETSLKFWKSLLHEWRIPSRVRYLKLWIQSIRIWPHVFGI